jgi:rRNA maturation endonuclease Nob1
MNEIHNLDETHFLVLNSNGTGRTTFTCKKTNGIIRCEEQFNFCPICGDRLLINR